MAFDRTRNAYQRYHPSSWWSQKVRDFLVPLVMMVVSFVAYIALLVVQDAALFATIASIMWALAVWKAFYYWEQDHFFGYEHDLLPSIVGALFAMGITVLQYFTVNFLTGASLFEIGPPSLLIMLSFVFGADFVYRMLELVSYEVTGGAGLSPGLKAVYFGVAVLVVGFLSFQLALGGDWGNLAQVAGPAGSASAQVVQTAADTAATSTNYVINSITHSPSFVRMQCVLGSGGLAGAAFTPSSQIQQCVDRKLNNTEESKAVTEPVELRLREPQLRPDWQADEGEGEMEVSIEAANTLVSDVAGRPLTIPAEEVKVTATWRWENEIVARQTSDVVDEIPNGNFEIFQFAFDLDRHASDPEDAEDNHLAAGFPRYTLELNGSYTFDAEAAFTDSSRWQTGDHTLKVWDYDAWISRPADFREQWQNQNCEEVAFQDFTYRVQRTAGLTTPIMPVVYADCGNRLAQDYNEGGDIDIDMSATQSSNSKSEVSVERFRIEDAMTDCGGARNDLEGDWPEIGEWQTEFVEAVGWDVTAHRVQRDVAIEGESTTISCFLNMSIRVGLHGITQDGITIRNESVG